MGTSSSTISSDTGDVDGPASQQIQQELDTTPPAPAGSGGIDYHQRSEGHRSSRPCHVPADDGGLSQLAAPQYAVDNNFTSDEDVDAGATSEQSPSRISIPEVKEAGSGDDSDVADMEDGTEPEHTEDDPDETMTDPGDVTIAQTRREATVSDSETDISDLLADFDNGNGASSCRFQSQDTIPDSQGDDEAEYTALLNSVIGHTKTSFPVVAGAQVARTAEDESEGPAAEGEAWNRAVDGFGHGSDEESGDSAVDGAPNANIAGYDWSDWEQFTIPVPPEDDKDEDYDGDQDDDEDEDDSREYGADRRIGARELASITAVPATSTSTRRSILRTPTQEKLSKVPATSIPALPNSHTGTNSLPVTVPTDSSPPGSDSIEDLDCRDWPCGHISIEWRGVTYPRAANVRFSIHKATDGEPHPRLEGDLKLFKVRFHPLRWHQGVPKECVKRFGPARVSITPGSDNSISLIPEHPSVKVQLSDEILSSAMYRQPKGLRIALAEIYLAHVGAWA